MGAIQTWLVDCSNWQEYVNWEAVMSDGYAGGIVKASEGTTYRDPYFPRNWSELARLSAIRGAYAFARPSRGAPDKDARVFWDYVSSCGLGPGDIPVLDMEDTDVAPDADLLGWTLDWLGYTEQNFGCVPWLYSGEWYMVPHGLWARPELARYPLWFASYVSGLPAQMHPTCPNWPVLTLWQYTSEASVPGVAGDCDSNATDLSAAQLASLGVGGAPLPPVEVPPRAPLDALWAAQEACRPVYVSGADQEDLAGVRSHINAIKNRYGYP